MYRAELQSRGAYVEGHRVTQWRWTFVFGRGHRHAGKLAAVGPWVSGLNVAAGMLADRILKLTGPVDVWDTDTYEALMRTPMSALVFRQLYAKGRPARVGSYTA